MRSLYFSLLAVLTILFAGLFLFSDAVADENTCTFKALPALLFSAIKQPMMIDLMAITTKPVKEATPFGYPKMLYRRLWGCIESGHLS